MKLWTGFLIFTGVAKALEKDPRSYYCDIEDLNLPPNAEKWNCSEAKGDLVPAGNDCKLICKTGFTELKGKLRNRRCG